MSRFDVRRACAVALLGCAVLAQASAEGNPDEGRKFFEIQCIACHSAEPDDGGGAQGPSLIGILGRLAGADKEFSYTDQLRNSKLVFDAATLDRFLAAPDQVVPGTMMVIAVPTQSDRDNLIAYFKRVAAKNKAAVRVPEPSHTQIATRTH